MDTSDACGIIDCGDEPDALEGVVALTVVPDVDDMGVDGASSEQKYLRRSPTAVPAALQLRPPK